MHRLAALLVLAPEGIRVQHARHGAETDEGHADDVTLLVERRVAWEEGIGRDDSSDVSEAWVGGWVSPLTLYCIFCFFFFFSTEGCKSCW